MWSKIQKLDLAKEYSSESATVQLKKIIINLSLLSQQRVENVFTFDITKIMLSDI